MLKNLFKINSTPMCSVGFCTYFFTEVLRDLGSLSGARLTLNDQDLVLLNGSQQVLPVGEDGQAASDLLHGLLLQLGLGKSRGLLVLSTTGSEEKVGSNISHIVPFIMVQTPNSKQL